MTKEYWSIDEISEFLNVKKSSLYSKVGSKEIPHYRIGKLIRFKLTEVEGWMQGNKAKTEDLEKRTTKLLRSTRPVRPKVDINHIVEKSVDELKKLKYNPCLGNQVESSTQKGGDRLGLFKTGCDLVVTV